jgi:glutamyl-tRNA synthetase
MVRTRIAPSPTGFPHIGTIYQVLFDYAYAKKHGGQFVVRLEDTDRARFVEGAEEVVFSALDWFGLSEDESPRKGGKYGPYRQSERLEIYMKHAEELVEKGHAYYCFCTKERLDQLREEQQKNKELPMYDKHCRNLSPEEAKEKLANNAEHVIRMKIPENKKVIFHDLIIGDIEFDSNTLDDQVILKSDGFPTYHLGVVVDDHLMEITHIFRGKEWIPSTPKHVLLYEFFGWEMPVHAHLPLILNDQGPGKLGKRFGHASVDFYRESGFLPEAVLNYLSNIVWNHPDDKEIYTLQEFIDVLDIETVTSQGARFDLQKLMWMNGEYIRAMKTDELAQKIIDFVKQYNLGDYSEELIKRVTPLVQERIKTLKEFDEYARFFIEAPTHETEFKDEEKELLQKINAALEGVEEYAWNLETLNDVLQKLAEKEEIGFGKFFMLIRLAITGKKVTPPINESLVILGKSETLRRLAA